MFLGGGNVENSDMTEKPVFETLPGRGIRVSLEKLHLVRVANAGDIIL